MFITVYGNLYFYRVNPGIFEQSMVYLGFMKKSLSFALSVLLTCPAIAQRVTGFNLNTDDDDPYEKKSYCMYGINYLSNNVYLGRKDSVKIPYTSPYIGYHFKSGFYGKAMISYTSHNKAHIDLTTLEAGYDHNFSDHLNAGVNLDKFFYSKKSTSIRSNTTGGLSVYGQYTNDWIEPQINLDANKNKNSTDWVTGIVLDHDFSAAGGHWHIIPAFTMNSGTQHYYDEYFTDRYNKKGKPVKSKAIPTASNFVPLDYEISTKITWYTGKWLFTAVPRYVIPTSPSTITMPDGSVKTEKISNTFYLELDVCHR